jgi:hypothetical protein
MTGDPDSLPRATGPELQPTTERVGGGLSARMTAIATVVLLVGVVWLGVSGRSDQADPAASPAPTAAGEPAATALPRQASPPPVPTFTPDPMPGFGEIVLGDDAYGVTTWLGDRFYMAVLRESQAGHLRATMRLPFAELADAAELSLLQLWTRADRPALATIGTHQLEADWLVRSDEPYTAVLALVAAQTTSEDAPRLARQGYLLKVDVQPMGSYSYLVIDIELGRPLRRLPSIDDVAPAPRFEAHLTRDGRLLSMVGLGGRPPGVMTGHIILHDRYGRSPALTLYHYPDGESEAVPVIELELDTRLLRRGHPEGFAGRFTTDGGEADWVYRITPIGTGFGILLLIEVGRATESVFEGTARLIQITRGWSDYGQRSGAASR